MGGKSIDPQHCHEHEVEEGRRKRRRADPAPATGTSLLNGVEHNRRQNNGVQVHAGWVDGTQSSCTLLHDLMFEFRPKLWQCAGVTTLRFFVEQIS